MVYKLDGTMCDCAEKGIEPMPFTVDQSHPQYGGETACENCGGLL